MTQVFNLFDEIWLYIVIIFLELVVGWVGAARMVRGYGLGQLTENSNLKLYWQQHPKP